MVVVVFVLIVVLVLVVVLILVVVLVLMVLHLLQGHQAGRLRVSWNVVVVPLAGEAVEMPGKVADAAIQAKRAVLVIAVVSPLRVELASDALRHLLRDASRARVHDATNGAGTVQQGCRPLVYLHPVCDERIHRHRVVAAGDGNVEGVDPILKHAHPRPGEAVNDGTTHRNPERTVVDADFAGHRLADVVDRPALEFLAGEHGM